VYAFEPALGVADLAAVDFAVVVEELADHTVVSEAGIVVADIPAGWALGGTLVAVVVAADTLALAAY